MGPGHPRTVPANQEADARAAAQLAAHRAGNGLHDLVSAECEMCTRRREIREALGG